MAARVIRFYVVNERVKRTLFQRIVRDDISLEEALALAYHTLRKTSDETKEKLHSVEIVDLDKEPATAPALSTSATG